MRIHGYVSIAAAGLAALLLAAIPGAGGQERIPVPPQATIAHAPAEAPRVLAPQSVLDLEALQLELNARLERLRAEMLQEVDAMEPEKLARLDELQAALQNAHAGLGANKDELLAQVEELAQEIRQEATPAPGPEVWAFDFGEESGWVGVQVAEVNADKAKELKLPAVRGVLVVEVEPNSPAAKAGLKSNDVIADYDRQPVEGVAQFRRLVRETPPGRSIPLAVWREGTSQSLNIEIGDRSKMMEREMRHVRPQVFGAPRALDFSFDMPDFVWGATPMLGINAEDLTGQLGAYFGAPGGEGILVRDVRSGSAGEKAGLKAGDVITKVDDQAVSSVTQLRERLRDKREQKTVKIGLLRKGSSLTLEVELEKPKQPERARIARRAAL